MYHWLAQHPDVVGHRLFPEVPLGQGPGETNVFNEVHGKVRHMRTHAAKVFGPQSDEAVARLPLHGDGSPSTYDNRHNNQDGIFQLCGGAVRFVVMLRDPAARAESLHKMRRSGSHAANSAYYKKYRASPNQVVLNNLHLVRAWRDNGGFINTTSGKVGFAPERPGERGNRTRSGSARRTSSFYEHGYPDPFSGDFVASSWYDVRLLSMLQRFKPSQFMIVFTEHLSSHGLVSYTQHTAPPFSNWCQKIMC